MDEQTRRMIEDITIMVFVIVLVLCLWDTVCKVNFASKGYIQQQRLGEAGYIWVKP